MRKKLLAVLLLTAAPVMSQAQRLEKHVIHFDFGLYQLRPESIASLDSISGTMLASPYDTLYLIGHTDSVGNLAFNEALSLSRVNAAMNYLCNKGIEAARLQIKYYGQTRPIADNKTDEGRERNRRVDLIIKKDCGCKRRTVHAP